MQEDEMSRELSRMREITQACKFSSKAWQEKYRLESLGLDMKVTIKWILIK